MSVLKYVARLQDSSGQIWELPLTPHRFATDPADPRREILAEDLDLYGARILTVEPEHWIPVEVIL